MELLTPKERSDLLRNGELRRKLAQTGMAEADFYPVVKLFTPDANATWLLSELYPDNPDIAFGLCDLGMGCPELGDVSIAELATVRGPAGLLVERDMHFVANKTLTAYAKRARQLGYIEA